MVSVVVREEMLGVAVQDSQPDFAYAQHVRLGTIAFVFQSGRRRLEDLLEE